MRSSTAEPPVYQGRVAVLPFLAETMPEKDRSVDVNTETGEVI